MFDILLWPFRFVFSIIGLVFDFVGSLLGMVFGLVGGVFGFLFSGAMTILMIIAVLAVVRWFVRSVRGS